MAHPRPTVTTPLLLTTLTLAMFLPVHSLQAATPTVAQVRYIDRGLTTQPPHHAKQAGHVKDPVVNAESLLTEQNQRASIGFHDGTVLQLNQNTDAIISTHLAQVHKGEVAPVLQPVCVRKSQPGRSRRHTSADVRTRLSQAYAGPPLRLRCFDHRGGRGMDGARSLPVS